MEDLLSTMCQYGGTSRLVKLEKESVILSKGFKEMLEVWWYFADHIRYSEDDASLTSLTLLAALWDTGLYENFNKEEPHFGLLLEHIYQPTYEITYTMQLICVANSNKIWLCKGSSEYFEALSLCFTTIRGFLVRASPLYTKFSNRHGTLREFLGSIYRYIVEMLKFDRSLASMIHSGQTLTEVAVKWRVLDIWHAALEEVGYSANEIIGAAALSELYRQYSPLHYTSWRNGADISFFEDETTSRSCVVIENVDRKILDGIVNGMVVDEWNVEEGAYHPATDILEEIWHPQLKLQQAHCEIRPIATDGKCSQ
jgi:hypothetical protein